MPIALMLFKEHLEYFTVFLIANQLFNRYWTTVVGLFKRVKKSPSNFELKIKAARLGENGGNVGRKVYDAIMEFVIKYKSTEPKIQDVHAGYGKITFGVVDMTTIMWRGHSIRVDLIAHDKTDEMKLSGESMKVLQDFVVEADHAYDAGYYLDQTGKSVYVWKGEWCAEALNVNKTRSNIYLDPSLEQQLFEGVKTFLNSEQYYQDHGIPYKKSYLFHGPPGTGKSAAVYAIANYFNMPLHIVPSGTLDSELTYVTSNAVPNSILLFEEIDIQSRVPVKPGEANEPSDSGRLKKLLALLDGYVGLKKCVIIFTSNFPERLDPALVRPGRIDEKFHFDLVDQARADRICMDYVGEYFPLNQKMTSSRLINEIILPNKNNKAKIAELMLYDDERSDSYI
jgi:hypothetical protein